MTEATRFVSKTIAYLESDAPYLEKVLLCGEHLGFGGFIINYIFYDGPSPFDP